ncbi:hypothetical protein EDD36DRAFT_266547 [Exophiala viscosa]|uniref:Uncharacterized protein n=1 Tax=Exophiala viscosa TaxID=2486360 RepID=A0AAN6DY79_9EURO|nr:hypothetical protein EDD36DRAFT_266547 [Exophiala viscosa]
MDNYEHQEPTGTEETEYADGSYGQDQSHEQDGNEQYGEYEEDPAESEQQEAEHQGWDEEDPTQYSQQGGMYIQENHMQQDHEQMQHHSAGHMQQYSHAVALPHPESNMQQHSTGHQQPPPQAQAQTPAPQDPAIPSQAALAKEEKEVAAPGESQKVCPLSFCFVALHMHLLVCPAEIADRDGLPRSRRSRMLPSLPSIRLAAPKVERLPSTAAKHKCRASEH